MKVPLPALILLLTASIIHPRRLLIPTGGVALILLGFTPNCRVQIGIRFVFPLIVLTYITVAAAIARGWTERTRGSTCRVVPRWLVAALSASLVATAAWVWPHGLSYFNQLWGGLGAGSHLLHDSNFDWGQGVPELRAWNEQHNAGGPLGVWYFGSDPEAARAPLCPARLSWEPVQTDAQMRDKCAAKYLAVSVSVLSNNPAPTPMHAVSLDWVRTHPVVARTTHFVIIQVRE
jgi:hypothetical protein